MRVTTRMLTAQTAANIMANAEAMQQTQRQLSTGKRMTRPADDPSGASLGVRLRAEQSRNSQYMKNIEHARTWLDSTDKVLGEIGDLLGRARELSVQAANGTFTANDTAQLAEEINSIRNQIMSTINSTVDVDQYVFAGQTSDASPIAIASNGIASFTGDTGVTVPNPSDLVAGNGISQISAQSPLTQKGSYSLEFSLPTAGKVTVTLTRASDGKQEAQTIPVPTTGLDVPVEFSTLGLNVVVNSFATTVNASNTFTVDGLGLGHEIAPGAIVDVNVSASAFLPILAQLKAFHTALTSGTTANSAANTMIGQVDTGVDRLLSLRAQVGAKTNQLDFAQARADSRDLESGRLISANEDIDLTEALSRFTSQQTVYKASLEIGSRVMQNSLMDFLR